MTAASAAADESPLRIPAPCSRCGQLWPLPIGPGDALCRPCKRAETADIAGRWRSPGYAYTRAGVRS